MKRTAPQSSSGPKTVRVRIRSQRDRIDNNTTSQPPQGTNAAPPTAPSTDTFPDKPSEQRYSVLPRDKQTAHRGCAFNPFALARHSTPEMTRGYFPPPDSYDTPRTPKTLRTPKTPRTPKSPKHKRQRTDGPDGDDPDSTQAPGDAQASEAPYRGYFPPPDFDARIDRLRAMRENGAGNALAPATATSSSDPAPRGSNPAPPQAATESGDENHPTEDTERTEISISKGKTVLRGEARRKLGVGKKVRDGFRVKEAFAKLAALGRTSEVYSLPFRRNNPALPPPTSRQRRGTNKQDEDEESGSVESGSDDSESSEGESDEGEDGDGEDDDGEDDDFEDDDGEDDEGEKR